MFFDQVSNPASVADFAHNCCVQLVPCKGRVLQRTEVRLCGHFGQVHIHGRAVEDQLQPAIGSAFPELSNELESQPLAGPKVIPNEFLATTMLPRQAAVR